MPALAGVLLLTACAQTPEPPRSAAERGLPVPLPVRVVMDPSPRFPPVPFCAGGPPPEASEVARRLSQERLSACLLDALIAHSGGRIVRAPRPPAATGHQAALSAQAFFVSLNSAPPLVNSRGPMTLSARANMQWLDASAEVMERGEERTFSVTPPPSHIGTWGATSLSMGTTPTAAQRFLYGERTEPARLFEWLQNDAALLEQEIHREFGIIGRAILADLFPELRDPLRASHPDGLSIRCPPPRT